MNFLKKIIENSKSGIALFVLGVVAIGFDFVDIAGLTGKVAQFAEGLEAVLVFMGARDLMTSEKNKIHKAVADFKSKTFWGVIITMFGPIFLDPSSVPGLPENLIPGFDFIGYIFMALGLGDAGKRGHFGNGS